MKIKLKTQEVLEKYNLIEEFIKKDINIPVQFAWNLEDNQEKFKTVVDRFEKHRQELLQPLNDKGAFQPTDDNRMAVKNEYIKEFNEVTKKLNDYIMTDNELEIKTVSKDQIPDMISSKDLRAIRFMIEK